MRKSGRKHITCKASEEMIKGHLYKEVEHSDNGGGQEEDGRAHADDDEHREDGCCTAQPPLHVAR